MKTVSQRLQTLQQLGLGYLTLGEETPSLSGGEAQRLKLASEIGRTQTDSVFVFDEPSIGLHPLDVQVLLRVFQALLDNGATVVVIEHDLDVIRNADYVIDMGPGGGRGAAAASWQQARRRRSKETQRVLPEDIYNKKGAGAAWHLPLRQYSYLLSGTPRSSARKRSGTSSFRIFLTRSGSFAVSPTG